MTQQAVLGRLIAIGLSALVVITLLCVLVFSLLVSDSPTAIRQREGNKIVSAVNNYFVEHGRFPTTLNDVVLPYPTLMLNEIGIDSRYGWVYRLTPKGYMLGAVLTTPYA